MEPRPPAAREWRHVIAPFAPAPDDPEIARYLSVAAGEHVLLLPSEPSEWSLAQKSSGELGYVPTSYLEKVEVAPPSAPADSWRRAVAIAGALPGAATGATATAMLSRLFSSPSVDSWAADIRALLSASGARASQGDGDGDGRSSQAEARRSIAEVPQARRSSLHGTAL